ncbi:P-loop containing nucleoside triphosphate hydrolase protein [Pleomassaria siparia CBS 279.74]|uniref:P-loop containing nucleoside triphosphate hydrolase protein n=1 Tax=Pleomassaria siparia CBS 279.74 TaxID=1314801 RepID=A0A6G1K1K0_9PLEO|nr:P-loop containing nucleoside triphosphate hydrolase protein [Pleomassaria siparia CBS 279.74]
MRQLHVDRTNNLVALPVQLADPSLGPPVLQVWGGTQYNACVHSVNRAVERVFVRITGYTPLYSITRDFIPQSAVFNVVFPLKLNILKSQRQGLDFVASELKSIHQGSQRAAHQELSRKVVDIITKATWSTTHANGTHAEFTSQGQPSNDWIRRMLFPDAVDGVMQTKLRTIPTRRGLFDHNMNYEQLQSVHSVCENEYGILPFLISGPPGTGKTKTLVELALNLLNSTNVGHVLICAPSDSAADTLALRLKRHLTPKQLLRLNGPNRADNEVPQDLLPYCYIEHDMFYIPPFPQLMAYNVVVTSTRDAAILTEVRLTNIDLWLAETGIRSAFHPETSHTAPTLHWGALLMDEAAQATEVESLPAISVVMPPSTYSASMPQPRFVMAGDQNQLGPRTASLDTKYATSLFERLFSRDLYDKHPLSRSSVRPSAAPPVMTAKMLPMLHPPFTNLIRNYRSHPAILSVPSQLFYHDTLIPEATILSTPLQTSPLWHGRKWPILFIAHAGPDDIERDGGGWYNHSEARVACHIAARLVTESSVAQKDVVIMSPFAAQVKVLRRFMRSGDYNNGAGMWDINIGPLEAFQGLESRVVIICTTRTRPRFLDMDAKRGLGIVGQKRKMNVALTRAKEALFVIGNPEVLGQDEHWRTFLGFCWRNRLVDKRGVLWNGEKESSEGKVGVLERALLVKEERQSQGKDQKTGRALGAGNVPKGLGDEEELWMEELKAVLEEYGDIDDDDDYEDDHAEEEDENEYTQDDPANASASMELADRESNSGDEVMQYVGRFRNGRPSF